LKLVVFKFYFVSYNTKNNILSLKILFDGYNIGCEMKNEISLKFYFEDYTIKINQDNSNNILLNEYCDKCKLLNENSKKVWIIKIDNLFKYIYIM
jgi:hypothetical protein